MELSYVNQSYFYMYSLLFIWYRWLLFFYFLMVFIMACLLDLSDFDVSLFFFFFSFLLQAITSTGIKKGDLFLADINTQLKNKNITTDIKVDTNSNVWHVRFHISFILLGQLMIIYFCTWLKSFPCEIFHEYGEGCFSDVGVKCSYVVDFMSWAVYNHLWLKKLTFITSHAIYGN